MLPVRQPLGRWRKSNETAGHGTTVGRRADGAGSRCSGADVCIHRGAPGSSTALTIHPSGGFGDPITLTAADIPPGVSVTPTPPVTVTSDAAGSYPSTSLRHRHRHARPGTSTITIIGTGVATTHSTPLALKVKRK
jgi:hypothetical protein